MNVDIVVYKDGHHGDLNETFCVGNVDQKSKDLVKTAHDALMKSLELVRPGCMFRDFGDVITKAAGKAGFSVVRAFCQPTHLLTHASQHMPSARLLPPYLLPLRFL